MGTPTECAWIEARMHSHFKSDEHSKLTGTSKTSKEVRLVHRCQAVLLSAGFGPVLALTVSPAVYHISPSSVSSLSSYEFPLLEGAVQFGGRLWHNGQARAKGSEPRKPRS